MIRGILTRPNRQWGLIISSGVTGFAIGVVAFARLGLDGIFRILSEFPAAAVGLGLSAVFALTALAAAALAAFVQERRRNRAARIAINNMTQGLSLYDGAASTRHLTVRVRSSTSTLAR